jgi:hypothetical protein
MDAISDRVCLTERVLMTKVSKVAGLWFSGSPRCLPFEHVNWEVCFWQGVSAGRHENGVCSPISPSQNHSMRQTPVTFSVADTISDHYHAHQRPVFQASLLQPHLCQIAGIWKGMAEVGMGMTVTANHECRYPGGLFFQFKDSRLFCEF